uniref:Uncharacterized protein n=1 Tax=Oryza sativa subsp. japonica TaxID=39947 RepID=Q6K1S8_ORYSJ|nr:hypothetical protein [Oryza sativa Japonica Group]
MAYGRRSPPSSKPKSGLVTISAITSTAASKPSPTKIFGPPPRLCVNHLKGNMSNLYFLKERRE